MNLYDSHEPISSNSVAFSYVVSLFKGYVKIYVSLFCKNYAILGGSEQLLFDYVRTLDPDDLSFSETLRDAVSYSLNQEEKLRRFLDDPMIPADNGFVERHIKPLATSRRNRLFSYSIDGAKAAAILFTLIETAKANQAHPYYYLKYLLETLPKQKIPGENTWLSDCLPWSEAYKAYEEREKLSAMQFFADQVTPERPRTPKKKDWCA